MDTKKSQVQGIVIENESNNRAYHAFQPTEVD